MKEILDYLPNLTEEQTQQFEALEGLYRDLNMKVNVISRKDIDNLYKHHILHSLFIKDIVTFVPGAEILDLGCGGGFPGIPLAILFPEVHFTLVDGTRKKIGVVQEIVDAIGLKNVRAQHTRAEEIKTHKFDFIITRAVASLEKLINWSFKLIKKKQQHAIPNGLFAWKGTNTMGREIQELSRREFTDIFPLSDFTEEEYFDEKCIVYVQGH
ncbi:MAG: 16S rRNA (guanine(527)-N(7))-methyltransferase RsmG [Saprospiraceae bacterium]